MVRLCAGTYDGRIQVSRDITIIGAGSERTILNSGGGGVVRVDQGITVSLVGFKITGGRLSGGETGAGVLNAGKLTLRQCAVTDNWASMSSGGGGIFNTGELILDQTDVTGNKAASGGGIFNSTGADRGRLTLRNGSQVAENEANLGGGIYNVESSTSLEDTSSVRDNVVSGHGANGGGIYAIGTATRPSLVFLNGDSRVADNVGGGIFHTGAGGVVDRGAGCVGPNTPYDCQGLSYCPYCER